MVKQTPAPSSPRQRIKRGKLIKVSLSEDMLARLVTLSELLGVPAGTVASLALGQYIAQQERSLGFLKNVSDQLGEEFSKALGEQLKLPTK